MDRKTNVRAARLASAALFLLGIACLDAPLADAGKPKGKGRGRDTTPPTLVCPSNVTTTATDPSGAVVTFSATATDDTDPAPTITFSPASGTVFPIATTTVTATATDWRGNSATCTFDVTVLEPQVAFAGTFTRSDRIQIASGEWVSYYEWTMTVAEDGTVSGTGYQTYLYVFTDGYLPLRLEDLPAGVSPTATLSGTVDAYGGMALMFDGEQAWMWEGEYYEDGTPIYTVSASFGGATRSASLDDAGDLVLVDPFGRVEIWSRQ